MGITKNNQTYVNSAACKAIQAAVFVVLFLSAGLLQAANIESKATGNWSNTATWSNNAVPVSGDIVTIRGTHTVTMNANATIGNDVSTTAINIYGRLEWAVGNSTYTLRLRGGMEILPGGTFYMGTVGSPIHSSAA